MVLVLENTGDRGGACSSMGTVDGVVGVRGMPMNLGLSIVNNYGKSETETHKLIQKGWMETRV